MRAPLIDPGPFPTSGCGASWNNLHAQVVNARTADGNQPGWIYYGLLPNGVPIGQVGGCGGGGVAVGPIGQPWTLAHEAGHAAGLPHAPAGGAPNPDPNYPAYEPYDTVASRVASVGEFGLNPNTGDIADPQVFRDVMGYAWPKWISPYNYARLTNNAILNPVTVGHDRPWWADWLRHKWADQLSLQRDQPLFDLEREFPVNPPPNPPQPMISVLASIVDGEVAEVTHVARTTMHTQQDQTRRTPFEVSLQAAGETLSRAPLRRLLTCNDCGCEQGDEHQSYLAQALLPDVDVGEALVITRGDQVVWERVRPDEPARVEDWAAELDDDGGLIVRWEASGSPTELWLRWSRNKQDWRVLATGLATGEVRIPADQLPTGEVLLELVAHDGFNSTPSAVWEFRFHDRRTELAILHPTQGHSYSPGMVRLWGVASDPSGQSVAAEDAAWWVDGEEVGRGLELWVELGEGEHVISLIVKDDNRGGEASVEIMVG